MKDPVNKVVFFSSGAASWLAAKRVAEKYGTANLYLVFADTSIEDSDNYRFLMQSAQNVGGILIWLKDGRTPWDVFFEKKFLNHRQSECSIELKIKPCRVWVNSQNFNREDTVLYFGIGFEEIDRINAIRDNWQPFEVETPLCWDTWADRKAIDEALKVNNLRRPRLYDMGFTHANCGGFCPKGGLGHFRNLLKNLPDLYKYHEEKEQEFIALIGKPNYGLLRKTVKGVKTYPTLKQWREMIEMESVNTPDTDEALGGCGCFIVD